MPNMIYAAVSMIITINLEKDTVYVYGMVNSPT